MLKCLSRPIGVITGLAVVLMVLHVFLGVVLRVTLEVSLLGTNAIVSYYYMATLTYLGVFLVSCQGAQIRVDVLANLFPAALRRVTDFIAEIISLLFFALFAWGLARIALQNTRAGETVDAIFAYVTVWPLRWVALVGIVLAGLVVARDLLAMARGKAPPCPAANEACSREEGL